MKKHDCNFFYGKTIITDLKNGSVRMKYCPLCGKVLGENKPLTVNELRKQNGKPVWVECFKYPNVSGYYIVSKGKKDNWVEVWGYDVNKFYESNYDDVWVAYLSKP